MLRPLLALPFAIALVASAEAAPIVQKLQISPSVELVADGCGVNRYRGPGGACHRYGAGPFPAGYFGPYHWNPTGCPPGYWRGPWGHCRDTPYHGYLPGGGYKP